MYTYPLERNKEDFQRIKYYSKRERENERKIKQAYHEREGMKTDEHCNVCRRKERKHSLLLSEWYIDRCAFSISIKRFDERASITQWGSETF